MGWTDTLPKFRESPPSPCGKPPFAHLLSDFRFFAFQILNP